MKKGKKGQRNKYRKKWSRNERNIYRQVGGEIGLECEKRILDLLLARKLPKFCIVKPRKATHEEDGAKMDIVIGTDRGTLGIQVKRNFYRAALEANHVPGNIICIGANEDRDDNPIWAELMRGMAKAYAWLGLPEEEELDSELSMEI